LTFTLKYSLVFSHKTESIIIRLEVGEMEYKWGRFEENGVLYKLGNLREMEYEQGSFGGNGVLGSNVKPTFFKDRLLSFSH
jgi:hypothetical protein